MKLPGTSVSRRSLRGLLATRHGAIALAVTCAAAAAAVLLFAMGQYRHSLSTSATQETVLVAKSEILKGTSADVMGAKDLYQSTPVLQSQVSPGAVVDAASLSGKVATSNILPGQQLTASDFTDGQTGIAAELTPSQRAISVSLAADQGLASVAQAGDQVDVYGDFDVQPAGNNNQGNHQIVRLLIAGANVLQILGSADGASGSATTDVVLGIQSSQVGTLAYAADNGKVWLVLRPPGATAPNTDLTTVGSILLGVQASASGTLSAPTVAFKSTSDPTAGQ